MTKKNIEDYTLTGVYIIRNIVTLKVYVGSSLVSFASRKATHFSTLKNNKHQNKYLQSAYNKYGIESFLFEILEPCNETLCVEREQYWIDFYNSMNSDFGYNILPANKSAKGVKRTAEQKLKISIGRKGALPKEKHHMFGKTHSQETRDKISKANKGKFLGSKNPMFGVPSPNKGKFFTEEHKNKISKALKENAYWIGKKQPKEVVEKRAFKNVKYIQQYDLDKNFLRTWTYKDLEINNFSKRAINKNKNKGITEEKFIKYKGFLWLILNQKEYNEQKTN